MQLYGNNGSSSSLLPAANKQTNRHGRKPGLNRRLLAAWLARVHVRASGTSGGHCKSVCLHAHLPRYLASLQIRSKSISLPGETELAIELERAKTAESGQQSVGLPIESSRLDFAAIPAGQAIDLFHRQFAEMIVVFVCVSLASNWMMDRDESAPDLHLDGRLMMISSHRASSESI